MRLNSRYSKLYSQALQAVVWAVNNDGKRVKLRIIASNAEDVNRIYEQFIRTLTLVRKTYAITTGRSRMTFSLANFSEIVVYLV